MPVETPRDAAAPRVTGSAEIDEPHPRIVRLLIGEIQGGMSILWARASRTSSPVLLGQIQGGIAILWARASTSVKNFVPRTTRYISQSNVGARVLESPALAGGVVEPLVVEKASGARRMCRTGRAKSRAAV